MEGTISPVSPQLVACKARRVWAYTECSDWASLDASEYLIRRRAVIQACVDSTGSSRSVWFVVDGDGIIACQGPEHNYRLQHGIPELLIPILRADPARVLVHVKQTP